MFSLMIGMIAVGLLARNDGHCPSDSTVSVRVKVRTGAARGGDTTECKWDGLRRGSSNTDAGDSGSMLLRNGGATSGSSKADGGWGFFEPAC